MQNRKEKQKEKRKENEKEKVAQRERVKEKKRERRKERIIEISPLPLTDFRTLFTFSLLDDTHLIHYFVPYSKNGKREFAFCFKSGENATPTPCSSYLLALGVYPDPPCIYLLF